MLKAINQPEKRLTEILPKQSGRDNTGQVSIRHQGGRHKRFYRTIDFKRNKYDMKGTVVSIEYDPNRTADVALIHYADGEKRYILSPLGLVIGDTIMNGEHADVKPGNAIPLGRIPVGTPVHAIELVPGKGAKLVRSAGVVATVLAREADCVHVKFPSGEIRRVDNHCLAVVGQVSNEDWRNQKIGTAGRARHMGKRPEVRGVAQNPRSHPHGGGEGRSGIGFSSPKSPWGKRTLGKKTRKAHRYNAKFIVERRK